MSNLVPAQPDSNFSGRSLLVTKKSLSEKKYRKMVFAGNVLLQMDKTLWVDNALVEVGVDQGNSVVSFDLKKLLFKLEVVENDSSTIDLLYSLCRLFNIVLPKPQKPVIQKKLIYQRVEVQRAFLDDGINEVILSSGITPDEFYVRLTKFQPL